MNDHRNIRTPITTGPPKFQPINAGTAAAVSHKLPDINAIVNSCDEMLKIAAHTREKAKLLQRQITEIGRASLARSRRTITPGGTALNTVDSELHQIHVTAAPKTMINTSSAASSGSSSSLSSAEIVVRPQSVQSQQPKLKTISTIASPHSARPSTTTRRASATMQPTNAKQTQSGQQQQRRAIDISNTVSAKANGRRNIIAIPKRSQQLQTRSSKGATNVKTTACSTATATQPITSRAKMQTTGNGAANVVMLSPTMQRAHTLRIDQSQLPRVTSAKQQQQQVHQQTMSGANNSPTSQSPKIGKPAR